MIDKLIAPVSIALTLFVGYKLIRSAFTPPKMHEVTELDRKRAEDLYWGLDDGDGWEVEEGVSYGVY